MREKLTQSEVDECAGDYGQILRNRERYCTLMNPDNKSVSCPFAVKEVVRDIGIGKIEKLQKVYLCIHE